VRRRACGSERASDKHDLPMRETPQRPWAYSDELRKSIEARLSGFDVVRRDATALGLKSAAVTIVIVALAETAEAPGEPSAGFLLTARPAKLRAHGGQLALPGGRVEAGESIEAAALRELAEELDIALPETAIIGRLDDYATRSGYLISPIVAWAPPGTVAVPSNVEVARLYRIPIAELTQPDAPEFFEIEESDRPVIRLFLPTLGGRVNAPTAAVLYQFREVALEGRATRVDHFDQPVWAWQ
jgi:8-oxo-dGTP pyrophosphatase MutT (NUDIX family)